jgi:hypothetical protein
MSKGQLVSPEEEAEANAEPELATGNAVVAATAPIPRIRARRVPL